MPRNVVLIILDTVRKDYFDIYADRIQSLSDTTVTQCRAASSWSVPSHTSMFTGTLPSEHGIHGESISSSADFSSLRRSDVFLDEMPGHRALGVSANPYVNSLFGFDGLFDEFADMIADESLFADGYSPYEYSMDDDTGEGTFGYLRRSLKHDHPLKSIANLAWTAVDGNDYSHPFSGVIDDGAGAISDRASAAAGETDEPFFMFLNYMDAHTPLRNLIHLDQELHSVPNTWNSNELHQWDFNKEGERDERYLRNYRALYGAAIEYLDRTVADLVEEIKAATDEETTFVITADHGHNLGYPADNGYIHHISSTSEGILHVPCEIIDPPEGFPETADSYFSHLTLGQLMADIAADNPYDPDLLSKSIVAETIGLSGTGDPRNHREFEEGEFEYWNRMIRCFYRDETKYQWDSVGQHLEYRLDDDRPCWQELESEDASIPDEAFASFPSEIDNYKQRVGSAAQDSPDADVEETLKDLGYM